MKCTDCFHRDVCEKRKFVEFADNSIDVNVQSENVCNDFVIADKVFLVDTEKLIKEKIDSALETLLDAFNKLGEALGTAINSAFENPDVVELLEKTIEKNKNDTQKHCSYCGAFLNGTDRCPRCRKKQKRSE